MFDLPEINKSKQIGRHVCSNCVMLKYCKQLNLCHLDNYGYGLY